MTTRIARRSIALAALLVVLGLVLPPAAGAQRFDPEQMRQRATAQVDETIKALAFEGETADRVKEILLGRVEKRFETMASMRGNRDGMRAAIESLNRETEEQLAEVLTEEQLAAWKKHEEELRAAGMMRRRPGN